MLRRDERGQSLVLVVMSMVVIVLIAAVAIDVSQWFVKHHQAQVTADAAALAAANYMGHGGTSSTATTFATTYAARNGLPITGSNVDVETGPATVAVTVPTTGALSFAGISFGSGPAISARAVASWRIRDCPSGGVNCAFMYAADNVCSGNTGVYASYLNNPTPQLVSHGITIAKNGIGSGTPITGNVVSASSITTNVNPGNTFNSTAIYSSASGCTGPSPSSPSPFTAAQASNKITSSYPIPYDQIYPACPGTSTSASIGTVTCNTTATGYNYPSYCTVDVPPGAANQTYTVSSIPNSSTIFCDAGSGSPKNPSTWNGIINDGLPGNATFIAGAVNISLTGGSSSSLGPASGSKLLAYAAECNSTAPSPWPCASGGTTTTSPVVTLSGNGSESLNGDIFAPAGVIDFNLGGTPPLNGFLEGWDIVYNVDGTATGQGPLVDNSGQFVGDYLIQ